MAALGVVAGLTLTLGLNNSRAQVEPPVAPQSSAAVLANVGTAFTYQGRLTNSGVPANGACDFEFKLYDDANAGTQVGSTQTKTNVGVSAGYFTIGNLDFGADAFNGQARWLAIGVRCPAGSGSYTALSPRQALTPAPHALALPGLWTQQNATSPNLIGGYHGNQVTGGVVGATIGGGGTNGNINRVTGDYGTVSGGRNNTASNSFASVGGGYQNNASSLAATIGGGFINTASNDYATVGGGRENVASGNGSTVGGGGSNTASSSSATVGGGFQNTASSAFATIPGGSGAAATHYGEMAYASGSFAATGDAQTSIYVLRGVSTGSSAELFLDGVGQRLTIAPGRTIVFHAMIVGRAANGESAGFQILGTIENVGGTTAYVGVPVVPLANIETVGWNASISADDTNDALKIEVISSANPVRWVAFVRTVEVQSP